MYVWAILGGSAIGLLATTLGRLYASAYYALRDTRTPLRFAVLRVLPDGCAGICSGPASAALSESFSFQSISFLPPRNATAAQLQAVRQRAANALGQAQATKSYQQFGLLAEKISDDEFHVMMGDHKAADRSKLPPVVVTALAAMRPGQVSGIIEFDASDYTILRLNAHLSAGMQKFETIQDSLRDHLTKQKTEQLRNALATKLTKTAKIEKA